MVAGRSGSVASSASLQVSRRLPEGNRWILGGRTSSLRSRASGAALLLAVGQVCELMISATFH